MQRLVIVGAGGQGRETLDVVEAINAISPSFELVGFVADGADSELLERRRAKVLGGTADLADRLTELGAGYHVAIGSSSARARFEEELADAKVEAITLVHPLSSLGSDNRIGGGVFLAAGARVTTNVTLGRHVHLNVNAVVSHDCVVGDFVTISPGCLVNGNVTLGRGVFLGTGAIILPGRKVGAETTIAAGAVVTTNIPEGITAKGVPARW